MAPAKLDSGIRLHNDIRYIKSSAIINMALYIVNKYNPLGNNFFDGIKNYLTKYQFKNADEEEFWNSFIGYNDLLKQVMSSYVNLAGYPLIYDFIHRISRKLP